jgi:hypothetical protein
VVPQTEKKYQTKNRYPDRDCGDRQQDLHGSFPTADATRRRLERTGTPFAVRRNIDVLLVRIGVPPPGQPKNDRNADQDDEKQRDYRQRDTFSGSAAEKDPDG